MKVDIVKMIYTVTMNPALDYVVTVESFAAGEVNRVKTEHVYFGGKGINVSKILKELGLESQCFGFVAGFTGKELARGVEEELGLCSRFIEVADGMTRINVKMRGDQETEINGMGPVVRDGDVEKLQTQLEALNDGDVLILSGSVPQTMDAKIYAGIMKPLQSKEIKVVVDATGELLLRTLSYRPFLIKPNKDELADLFEVEIHTIEEVERYARKLQDMGAQNVLISMAKDGSLLIDEDGQSNRIGVCQGEVVNSVGAGDYMVAGFVAGCLSGKSYADTLKLATACGGATAFSRDLAKREKIEEMVKQWA